MGLSDPSVSYGTYITESLKTLGTGFDDELLIGIITNSEGRMVTYFDTSSDSHGQSEKMSCLVRKQLSLKYPDTDITQRPHEDSLDTDAFRVERGKYMQWIIVDINTSVSITEMDDILTKAIAEYYGAQI